MVINVVEKTLNEEHCYRRIEKSYVPKGDSSVDKSLRV